MNQAEARSLLRWALLNPNEAERIGTTMWSEVGSLIPQVMTTAGAYLLSEWLSKRFGSKTEGPSMELPSPMALPMPAEKSAGEQIEPPENQLEWQKQVAVDDQMREAAEKKARGALRRVLAGGIS